jgi:hypothetical protein
MDKGEAARDFLNPNIHANGKGKAASAVHQTATC